MPMKRARQFRSRSGRQAVVRLLVLTLCLFCAAPVLRPDAAGPAPQRVSPRLDLSAEATGEDMPATAPPLSAEPTDSPADVSPDFTIGEMEDALQLLQESDIPYLLCDAERGQTLLAKDSDAVVNASLLARMMGCLIVLENHGLTDKIRATGTSVSADGRFTITVGESYTVGELVNTALIGNADNAMRLLAENTELSNADTDSFLSYMNERALRIGMNNTYFTSVDGSQNVLQKTTVADMALFLRYAMGNSRFKTIYCSPYVVSWHGVLINNPNSIAIVHTSATVGGNFGFFDNTGFMGTTTYYFQRDDNNEQKSSQILLIVSGLTADNLALMQNALLHEFRGTWEKVLYARKDSTVNTVMLGEGELSMAIGSNVYFYVPVMEPDFVEAVSFSYFDDMSPDTIQAPINSGDILGTVRYRLKDGTTIDAPLYAKNTLLSERLAVNNLIELMASYSEFFWGVGILFLAAAAIALYKIISLLVLRVRR